MNDLINTIFGDKKADSEQLLKYGFSACGEGYVYAARLENCGFNIKIFVTPPAAVSAEVYDDEGEIYTLHLVDEACGGFVGQVKSDYENALLSVAESCFKSDAFKARQARLVAQYARSIHGDELEFLWDKFPDCAVLRRKDNRKWYAAILTAAANKFGLEGDKKVELLDVRVNPEEIPQIIDNKYFFAGYHMNKKHWLTVLLDFGVDTEKIYKLLDESYVLAKK